MFVATCNHVTDNSPLEEVTLPSSDGLSMQISILAPDIVGDWSTFSFLILSRGEARGEIRGEALGDGLGDTLGDILGEAFGVPFGDFGFLLLYGFVSGLESSWTSLLSSSELTKTSFSLSGESGTVVRAAAAVLPVGLKEDSKGLKFISR